MPDWLTVPEAAELSEYSAYHIRHLLKTGKLKGAKKGRDWWVEKQDLVRYVAEVEKLGTKKHRPSQN